MLKSIKKKIGNKIIDTVDKIADSTRPSSELDKIKVSMGWDDEPKKCDVHCVCDWCQEDMEY